MAGHVFDQHTAVVVVVVDVLWARVALGVGLDQQLTDVGELPPNGGWHKLGERLAEMLGDLPGGRLVDRRVRGRVAVGCGGDRLDAGKRLPHGEGAIVEHDEEHVVRGRLVVGWQVDRDGLAWVQQPLLRVGGLHRLEVADRVGHRRLPVQALRRACADRQQREPTLRHHAKIAMRLVERLRVLEGAHRVLAN